MLPEHMQVDGSTLMLCSGYQGLARYCCVEHQKAHWARHKAFCKPSAELTKAMQDLGLDRVRSIALGGGPLTPSRR